MTCVVGTVTDPSTITVPTSLRRGRQIRSTGQRHRLRSQPTTIALSDSAASTDGSPGVFRR